MTGKIRFLGDLSLFSSFNLSFFPFKNNFRELKRKVMPFLLNFAKNELLHRYVSRTLPEFWNIYLALQRLPKKYTDLAETIIQLWLPYKLLFYYRKRTWKSHARSFIFDKNKIFQSAALLLKMNCSTKL